jgi:hypothetical protein
MISASGVRKLTDGQLNLAFSICGSETTPLLESMQCLQSSAEEIHLILPDPLPSTPKAPLVV